jgi:O-antigen ligase
MNGAGPPDRVAPVLRIVVLALLAAAPLAFGSVHELAFIPLLALSSLAGLVSWAKGHWARALGASVPKLPGRGALIALHLLVLVQMVPLPPWLLRLVSPGSFSFYNDRLLLPLSGWRPVSVSPPDTARGLAFLCGFTLLYGVVFREFGGERRRRRLAATVVGVGLILTVVGLVQARSGQPAIYGIWRSAFDWAGYGPYVNRNHFAGYLVMAIPIALGFGLEALAGLRRAWGRRRVGGWLALGGPESSALVWRGAVAMALVAGLVASESRGGFVAFVLSCLVLPFAARHRRQAVFLVFLVAALGITWIGIDPLRHHFASRGIQGSRIAFWADMLPLVKHFPLLGVGFNAFATAYAPYQTIWRRDWIGEAHCEYLQALLDTGIVGASLVGWLLLLLFRRGFATASRSPFDLGVFGSLSALAFHNTVEFNWQIPANAATFVALSALALRRSETSDRSHGTA